MGGSRRGFGRKEEVRGRECRRKEETGRKIVKLTTVDVLINHLRLLGRR